MPPNPVNIQSPPKQSELLRSLSDFRKVLPISEHTRSQALTALHHPFTNAQKVADTIVQDPALFLQITFSVNSLLKNNDAEARYLTHSISLLGLPQVERIIKNTPTYAENEGYDEQLNQSWIAADLCRNLKLNGDNDEPTFINCLMTRFHELALWSQFPERMQQIEQLKANPVYNHDHIETRVLGMTIDDIGKHLSAAWPLNKLTLQCWSKGFTLTPKPNNDTTNTLKLCHVVSSLGCRNWNHRETQKAIELLAEETHLSKDSISQLSRQSTIAAPLLGWYKLHPAARLLQHWDYRETIPMLFFSGETDQPNTAATTKNRVSLDTSRDPRDSNAFLLEKNIQHLELQGAQFKDLNQLFLFSLKTLTTGLNATQAAILVLNNKRTHLRAQYTEGDQSIAGITIPLNSETSELFNRLLHKTSSITISRNSSAQVITQLPNIMRMKNDSETVLLMSIFHQKQPIGIVYINTSLLNENLVKNFKRICTATNSAITQLARAKRQPDTTSTE